MSKNPYSPPQAFPVPTNATTAEPNAVAAITPSPVYPVQPVGAAEYAAIFVLAAK